MHEYVPPDEVSTPAWHVFSILPLWHNTAWLSWHLEKPSLLAWFSILVQDAPRGKGPTATDEYGLSGIVADLDGSAKPKVFYHV